MDSLRMLYESSPTFDSVVVKKLHQIITTQLNGKVPKNFCWITLIPGNYIVTDLEVNVQPPTFIQLSEAGLLMEIYYHPDPGRGLLLLPTLNPVFLLAGLVSKGLYHTDGTNFGTSFNVPIQEAAEEIWNCRLGTSTTEYRRWPTRRLHHGVWTKQKTGKDDEIRLWFRLARSKTGFTTFKISGEQNDEKVNILYVCTTSKISPII